MASDNTPPPPNPQQFERLHDLSAREHEMSRVRDWTSIGSMALLGASFLAAAPAVVTATVVGSVGLCIASIVASMKTADIRRARHDATPAPITVVLAPEKPEEPAMEPEKPCCHKKKQWTQEYIAEKPSEISR